MSTLDFMKANKRQLIVALFGLLLVVGGADFGDRAYTWWLREDSDISSSFYLGGAIVIVGLIWLFSFYAIWRWIENRVWDMIMAVVAFVAGSAIIASSLSSINDETEAKYGIYFGLITIGTVAVLFGLIVWFGRSLSSGTTLRTGGGELGTSPSWSADERAVLKRAFKKGGDDHRRTALDHLMAIRIAEGRKVWDKLPTDAQVNKW